MSQKKNGGIYFERELFQSEAFLSLSRNGIKMLFALLDARQYNRDYKKLVKKGFRGIPKYLNTKELKAPFSRLKEKYKMNSDGIVSAKTELLKKGFIQITHEGGLGKHDMATFELIDDYKQWKPGKVFRKRSRDVHRGFQGKRLGATDPKYKKTSHRKPDPYARKGT